MTQPKALPIIVLFFLTLVSLCGPLCGESRAVEPPSVGLGGLLGLGIYDLGLQATYGVRFQYRFSSMFEIGATNNFANLYSVAGIPTSTSVSATHYNVDFDYHFSKYPIWVGPKLGVWVLNSNAAVTLSNGIAFTGAKSLLGFEFGGVGGYDYPVNDNFSMGGELSFLLSPIQGIWVFAIQLMGSVKYQF